MGTEPPVRAGILGSLQSLADDLLCTVEERAALFSVEVQEEKLRLIRTFFWISAVLIGGTLAITFASLAVVYLFWDSARTAVLCGLAATYAIGFGVLLLGLRRHLARQPRLLEATLRELELDRRCIPPRN